MASTTFRHVSSLPSRLPSLSTLQSLSTLTTQHRKDPTMSNITTILAEPLHPYYPLNAEITHYAANKTSVPSLLAIFFTTCSLLFTTTTLLARALNPHLTRAQVATVIWFVLSGSIHLVFEGYYVAHGADLGGSQSVIAQMWKEYAFSDSRYLTRNGFVWCVESLTVVLWGPGCFLCAWLVARGHPARWGVVGVVSMGQLYGGYKSRAGEGVIIVDGRGLWLTAVHR